MYEKITYNDKEKTYKILEILKNNGIVVIPTDTVYGLIIKTDVETNYNKLLKIKNRPKDKLFSIVVSSIEQIKEVAYLDNLSENMIKKFMPGPITIVLKKKENVFPFFNSDTIGIRMAEDNYLKEIIEKLGMPLWLTSANKSGAPTPNASNKVIKQLGDEIDGIVTGKTKDGVASTVVSFENNSYRIFREGPITEEMIKKEIKEYISF